MFRLALLCLLVALLAAFFGSGLVPSLTVNQARAVFAVFLTVAGALVIVGVLFGNPIREFW